MDAKKGAGKPVKAGDNLVAFSFHQKIPIPSYLLAIAVGKLESRKLGPRSAVWAEAPLVEMAAADFSETEEFLAIGESLLGDYAWGRYDLLVLPPSFPFGGMENPTLTFVTPTILSGDKANADVVAHEIAHSWTGNLVGPQTWRDFWLNEGFTVYVERKISSRISKKGVAEFDLRAREGWSSLVDSVEQMESCGHSQWNSLSPDLGGHDPDDAFSSVPYERGFFFLYHLQDLVGSPKKFEKFVKSWIQSHANQAVTVDQFKAFFADAFPDVEVDWDLWINGEGLPPTRDLDDSLLSGPEALAANIIITGGADVKPSHIAKYTPKQVVVLLDAMLDTVRESETPLHPAVLTRIEGAFKFGSSPNCELKFRWTMIGLRSAALAAKFTTPDKVHDVVESYADFLTAGAAFAATVGRMKYTRPLYKGINAVGERGRKMAIDTFAEHCDSYHPVTRIMVATDLGLDPKWDSADLKRRLSALRRLHAAEQRIKEAEARLALSSARTESVEKRTASAEAREYYLSRVEPMAQHLESKLKRLVVEEQRMENARRKAREDSTRREQADRANFIAKLATR
jgi:leukotriene-A4 hydrolase